MKLGPRFIGDPMKAKTGKKTTDRMSGGYQSMTPYPKKKAAPRKTPKK